MGEEHYYSEKDRRRQLRLLAERLRALVAFLEVVPALADRASHYGQALAEAERLQREGFTRAELVALSDAVPDLFSRHREWEPPAVRRADGSLAEVPWFAPLEERLQPALEAASWLRQIGWY
jgi:hypothetical protein